MSWHTGYIEWQNGSAAYLSVVFSWQVQRAYQRAVWWRSLGYDVIVGGPAAQLNPHAFKDVAVLGDACDALWRHNPMATFTSRGCIRQCGFCAVPELEGDLQELDRWEPKPIVCDNNLLACSRRHFDRVVDRLKPLASIDFNQGLDARLLTKHHAERLTELDLKRVRLAWDHVSMEQQFMEAYRLLRGVGIPKRKIGVYVLIGYDDTPDDARYRLEALLALGVDPNPMRFQPLWVGRRNQYVAPSWTAKELCRFANYFSRLRWFRKVPFDEFRRVPSSQVVKASKNRGLDNRGAFSYDSPNGYDRR